MQPGQENAAHTSHMANDSHWCKPLAFDGTRPSELAELERLEEEVQAVS